MRRLLNWIVSDARARWGFRLVTLVSLALMFWVYQGFRSLRAEYQQRIQTQSRMWVLEHEVYVLRLITADSILENSRKEAHRGMLAGWMDFARWSERLRTNALRANLDLDWKVEELREVPLTDGRVWRFPVTLKIMPYDRSFEKTLRFVESVSRDTAVVWSLDALVFMGDGNYMTDNQVSLNGWMIR